MNKLNDFAYGIFHSQKIYQIRIKNRIAMGLLSDKI